MVKNIIKILLLFILAWPYSNSFHIAQAYITPELPRVYLTTTVASTSVTGQTITVPAGGDFQAALNNANLGDQIILTAGATYTGNFTLPNKTTGSGWITIRTSNMAGIPAEGVRATPSNASAMPKIISPTVAAAIQTAPKAHNYRFIGIQVGTNVINIYRNTSYGLVDLGGIDPNSPGGEYYADPAQLPHDIILDRMYIHGNPHDDDKRGVAMNGAYESVVDSYISEIHGEGFDAQAIQGYNGPGPFKIVNNYLEGAGENVLFGGADPKIVNNISSDIEFRNNFLSKPLSWRISDPSYIGDNWSIKNVFELKNAQRVLIDGNIIERSWAHSQSGFIVLFTGLNDGGACTWCTVKDVTFTNNIVRSGNGAVQISGQNCYAFPGCTSTLSTNLLIRNNLFYDISGAYGEGSPTGRFLQMGRINNLTVDHNTTDDNGDAPVIFADQKDNNPSFTPMSGLTFNNNIFRANLYGVFSSNGAGTTGLNNYAPGYIFLDNILGTDDSQPAYPTTTQFSSIANFNASFVNRTSANYALQSASPYKNAGTDGKDIGVDMTALNTATSCTLSGSCSGGATPPPPPPTPVAGDLNLDHIVNSLDWSIMNSKWFTTDATSDLNHDGLVNAIDFSILNANWFKTW